MVFSLEVMPGSPAIATDDATRLGRYEGPQ
jgi:hypothetical protein